MPNYSGPRPLDQIVQAIIALRARALLSQLEFLDALVEVDADFNDAYTKQAADAILKAKAKNDANE